MMDLSTIGQVGISIIPTLTRVRENALMKANLSPQASAIFRQRLKDLIQQKGLSARRLSLMIGANAGYVRDMLDPEKTSVPSEPRARALAAALETTTDFLFGRSDGHAQPTSEVEFSPMPKSPLRQQRDRIPVLGTGYCDDLEVQDDSHVVRIEQTLFEPTNVVRLIERPSALSDARDAYAIYFHGSSMEPRHYQGDIAIVVPGMHPRPGDDVVVQLNDGTSDDVVHVLVKKLVRTTSAYVELEQFNPPIIFRIDRRRITRLHKIARTADIIAN